VKQRNQRRPTSGDARAHGADRDIEDFGDLGIVEAGEVAQHDGDPKLLGKPGQGGVDGQTIINAGFLARRRRWLTQQPRVHRPGAPPLAPELVEGGVNGDAVSPSPEAACSFEAMQIAHDGEQGFLGGVVAVRVGSGDAPANGMDPSIVVTEKVVECLAVPLARSTKEPEFVVDDAAA
jgi:hypothetical protein